MTPSRALVLVLVLAASCLLLAAGPAAAGLNQWTSNGPDGGPVLALALDPQSPNTLYAGTNGGGVFRSVNGGATWTAASAGLGNPIVRALAVDPQAPATVYAGTPTGLFKSTTSGATWSLALDAFPILSIAVDPQSPATLYAGSTSVVLKSADAGVSWAIASTQLPGLPVNALLVHPTSSGTVYAGNAGGVYASTNGGQSWSPLGTLLPVDASVTALAIDIVDALLYAGTTSPTPTSSGVFRFNLTAGSFWSATGLTGTAATALGTDPLAPGTIYAGSAAGVFKTTNTGFAWEPMNSGLPSLSVAALAVDPQTPGTLYAGSGTGIAKSTTGAASWAAANTGLLLSQVTAVAVNPQAPATVYAGTQGAGAYRSTDGGASWTAINAGLTTPFVNALALDPAAPSTLYAATACPGPPVTCTGGGVFKSGNGGSDWFAVTAGLTNLNVNTVAVDPHAPATVYAGTSNAVFKTTDGGQSWAQSNTGIGSTQIRDVAVDPHTAGTVYVGAAAGLFKSVDGGASWVAINGGFATPPSVRSVTADPHVAGRLYAGTTQGVFQSADGGASWAATGPEITETSIRVVRVDPATAGTVYAGTSGGGVFRTTDGGSTWAAFNPSLTNDDIRSLALSPSGICLHAGSFGGGVFDLAIALDPCSALSPPVAAAVLPSSRSVPEQTTATVFATIVNPNPTTARACEISLLSEVEATLSYQTTDPATNLLVGTPDTPADIPPGGSQSYLIAITPTDSFSERDVQFAFSCTGVAPAPVITGVNTLLLVSSTGPRPDIVALAASDSGIVNVPGPTGTGVFAVATVNLGSDGTITASADTGGVPLPVVPLICETEPATGVCKDAPALSVQRGIQPGQTPTYGIFVVGTGGEIPFDPAVNRIFVRFKQGSPGSQTTRGSTSVAVRTQ